MSLEAYIENDPRVRRVHLISQACISLAVAIFALSLTQIVFYIDKVRDKSNNTTLPQTNCQNTKKTDSLNVTGDINTHNSTYTQEAEDKNKIISLQNDQENHYSQKLINSGIISLISAVVIAGIGILTLNLRETISFAEIKNDMDYELNEIKM